MLNRARFFHGDKGVGIDGMHGCQNFGSIFTQNHAVEHDDFARAALTMHLRDTVPGFPQFADV